MLQIELLRDVCESNPVNGDTHSPHAHCLPAEPGLSHRVITHAFSDTWRTLDRLRALGYRRPGIVLELAARLDRFFPEHADPVYDLWKSGRSKANRLAP
ncbi:MAG: hypothetical protein ACREH8_01800 [Opitutaceae bacterium]